MNTKIKKSQFIIGTLLGAVIVLVFAIGFVTMADIASDFCAGNVCASQEIAFKADAVCGESNVLQYFYTQHVKPGGKFKVQFVDTGTVDTSCAMFFAVTDFENFDKSVGKYGHYDSTDNPSKFGSETTTQFSFKVESADGLKGNLDFVMWLTIPETMPTGVYNFKVGATEYNQNYTSGSLKLYVDSNAPSNDNEGDGFVSATGWSPCADSSDNDLSYRRDCADANCLSKIGKADCVVSGGCLCEAEESTCFDRFDNDFDKDGIKSGFDAGGDYDPETGADCRDLDCNEQQGDANDLSKKCYFKNEFGGFPSSCADYFNNDADQGTAEAVNAFANLAEAYLGKNNTWYDCLDDDCWRKGGENGPCPAKEMNCNDGIDNDYDDGLNTKDEWPLTGADCNDYDCVGDSNCPTEENLDKDDKEALAQCFDGIDNDLDAYEWKNDKYVAKTPFTVDCGDPDCKGAQNPEPPFNVCSDNEFVVGQYQYCANPKGYLATLQNGIDDDGDQLANCKDNKGVGQSGDCWQKFGNCGPCPSKEFWKYDACADSLNNDFDTTIDCGDVDCTDKIGRLNGVTYCGGENSTADCSDNFDNDGDGKLDCVDKNCDKKSICEFGKELTCSDGLDNDGDKTTDCVDANCVDNSSSCVSLAKCLGTLPSWNPVEPGQLFATGGFLKGAQTDKLHSTDNHQIIIQGNGTYNSLTITIGNATKQEQFFPYNSTLCKFDNNDTKTDQLVMTSDQAGHILQIINKPKQTIVNPLIKIRCPASSILKDDTEFTYPAALDATRLVNNVDESESGELLFTTKVFTDATAPSVEDIKVINEQNGTVKVPYGGAVFIQTTPSDASKICKCDFLLNQTNQTAVNGCQAEILDLKQDVASFTVQARAEDGAGNQGVDGPTPAKSFQLNVLPRAKPNNKVTLNKAYPFYAPNEKIVFSNAIFEGPENNLNGGKCRILVDNTPVVDNLSPEDAGTDAVNCHSEFTTANEGEHKLSIKFTDNQGDIITTSSVVFYVCGIDNDTDGCKLADFDQDGVPERTYTTMYGGGDGVNGLACDNCVGLNNPDQEDSDGDGIGDACETEKHCQDNKLVICENDKPTVDLPEGSCPGCCVIGKCVNENDETKGSKQLCCSDNECPIDNKGKQEKCKIEINPWLETKWSDIYGGKSINLAYPPPDKFNATFCILTSGEVIKFTSEKCTEQLKTGDLKLFKTDKVVNLYAKNVLSSINLKKLEQKALSVEEIPTSLNDQTYLMIDVDGDGKIEINNPVAFGNNTGAGTIIVKGDLKIKGNLTYDMSVPDKVDSLASPGFIVTGNIIIDPMVTSLVGVYFAGGTIYTGITEEPFVVQGVMTAHQFNFQRQTKSLEFGSEQIIYDGRAAANPPPGMGDFVKMLPVFREVVP